MFQPSPQLLEAINGVWPHSYCPATAAHIMPAAPAPTTMTSKSIAGQMQEDWHHTATLTAAAA